MAEINYAKAEKEVGKAVQNTKIRSLVEGKSVTSKRAIEFYGLEEDTPRPPPGDRVERLISETAAEEEEEAKKEKKAPPPKVEGTQPPSPEAPEEEGEELEEEFEIITQIPRKDTLKKARKLSQRTPQKKTPPSQSVLPAERFQEKTAPLLILRKHILWFKRQHIEDRYERLGTTKDEVFALRKAERLTDKQLERVLELNARAEDLKKELLKKSGKGTSEEMIEKEKLRHKRKRFHTRETWVPL